MLHDQEEAKNTNSTTPVQDFALACIHAGADDTSLYAKHLEDIDAWYYSDPHGPSVIANQAFEKLIAAPYVPFKEHYAAFCSGMWN